MIDQFLTNITGALRNERSGPLAFSQVARLAFSEIETPLTSLATFASALRSLQGRYRAKIETLLARQVRRLLIAPVPGYLLEFLPDLVAEFPDVVLADNFKAGTTIAGVSCITLEEALGGAQGFDACLLGTIDQQLGILFREQLPVACTIGAAELVWLAPAGFDRPVPADLQCFQRRLSAARRPLLVVTGYLDATFGATLEALQRDGTDVFIVTRCPFATQDGANAADPGAIGDDCYYVAEFDEMLWLLRHIGTCPVLVNYVRFSATQWDLRKTIPIFAYGIAVLKSIAGPKLLQLYDPYQPCTRGLENEEESFALYRDLLAAADGVLVNADAVSALRRFLGMEKPMISFLRYGPEAEVYREPDPGPFSVVMITHFLGEGDDPMRMTEDAVRSLLCQGIHVHYYISGPTARAFVAALPIAEASRFHLHEPIRDQRSLVREISRYSAGWFVFDMSRCDAFSALFTTQSAKDLAACFLPSTAATAGLLYGCAGLPTFFTAGVYAARLFPAGAAIEIELAEVSRLGSLISSRDWSQMRQDVFAARQNFSAAKNIGRLAQWIDQFRDSVPR